MISEAETAVLSMIITIIILLVKVCWKIGVRVVKYLKTETTGMKIGGSVIAVMRETTSLYMVVIKPKWKRAWEEFGGRANNDESPDACAMREWKEEGGEWMEQADLRNYFWKGTTVLTMRGDIGSTYRYSVHVIEFARTVNASDLLEWSQATYQDRGYDHPCEIELDFISIDHLTSRSENISFSHGSIKLSGRLKRTLRDKNVWRHILSANYDTELSISDEGCTGGAPDSRESTPSP